MPNRFLVAFLALFLFVSDAVAQDQDQDPMTNDRLEELLMDEFGDDRVEGQGGVWRILVSEDDEAQAEEEPGEEKSDELGEQPSDDENDDEGDESPDLEAADDEAKEVEIPGASDEEKLPPVMVVLTDDRANRMRLMMPIRRFDPSKENDLRLALIALHSNYDRALDARYALKDGVLLSVFIHPLESLTDEDFRNAIAQVRALRKNTGTTFSSSGLLFGARAPEKQEEQYEEEEDEETDF